MTKGRSVCLLADIGGGATINGKAQAIGYETCGMHPCRDENAHEWNPQKYEAIET